MREFFVDISSQLFGSRP